MLHWYIFFLFFCTINYGQKKRTIRVNQLYELQNQSFIDRCEVKIAIPSNYAKRQKILNIEYSVKPKKIYTNGETEYALFSFRKKELRENKTFNITIDLEITDYDLGHAKKSEEQLNNKSRRKYLSKKGLYKLPRQIDNNIAWDKFTTYKKVRLIQEIVENKLDYKTYFGKDLGAKYALTKGKGDCTEYSDLMIALCRRIDIPARRISGYTVPKDTTSLLSKLFKSKKHAWVEVFFDEFGWVPFDPTHSDDNSITSFTNLENKYIYIFFENNLSGISWTWWGKQPMKIVLKKREIFDLK